MKSDDNREYGLLNQIYRKEIIYRTFIDIKQIAYACIIRTIGNGVNLVIL